MNAKKFTFIIVAVRGLRPGTRLSFMAAVGVFLLVFLTGVGPVMASDLHVDASASGANNGSSWADAFTNLQSALAVAESGDTIHVAQGTYKPTAETTPGDARTATFQLEEDVTLLGGYPAGGGSPDPVANETTLSGDIGTEGDSGDNSYHVVKAANVSAVLDGFTITAGNADGWTANISGGGMFIESGIVTLKRITFAGNSAYYHGGGMWIAGGGQQTLTDVTFSDNSAGQTGGGLYAFSASPTLTDVTFSGNWAQGGGGMTSDQSPMLTNVTFTDNSASLYGGGMNIHNGHAMLTNVTFSGNSAGFMGGGGMYIYDGSATSTNVTFSGNSPCAIKAVNTGAAVIRNTILWGDTSEIVVDGTSATVTISDSVVEGGCAGGTNIITEDPMLGTLGDYGGYTETIPLLEGSSAINAASSDYAPATDQRGVSRPQGAGYDIGAYEAESPSNGPPQIGTIATDPAGPMPVDTLMRAEADFYDPDTGDTHTAMWDWGDETTCEGSVDDGSQMVYGEHAYASAGVYTVGLGLEDRAGEMDVAIHQYAVVFDPAAGFVTGGGWIYSEPGYYAPDETLYGKASFGFVSKYKKGATEPTGNTEFQFHAGDLSFHSSSYDWLVVTGSDYAMFKGKGTINGSGDYRFRIWAGDDDPDTFRIRIWTEDADGVETDVYDNGFDQAIGDGSIVIHTK